MAAYTQSIDLHIAQTLRLRGYVTPEMLPGLDDHDAADMLRQYNEAHSDSQKLQFDGHRLEVIVAHRPVQTLETQPSGRSGRTWVIAAVAVVVFVAIAAVGFNRAGVTRSTSWPASPDRRAALYYFGTST